MIKTWLRDIVPPLAWRTAKRLLSGNTRSVEWEYVPEGWPRAESDSNIKGWDVDAILSAYQANWPTFLQNTEGTLPLGISPESSSTSRTNLDFHNIVMTYGYALALVTRNRSAISMLDWGGSIGHYYHLSHILMPDIAIDYHCKDFPRFADYGAKLFPEATFYTDSRCFERRYDFVLASTSLHYSQDWERLFEQLANAATGHLFIHRLPVVHEVPGYVMLQRSYSYGYDTEYLSWCFNRKEFLRRAAQNGLRLVREFVAQRSLPVHNAPEQPEYWSFLFQQTKTL